MSIEDRIIDGILLGLRLVKTKRMRIKARILLIIVVMILWLTLVRFMSNPRIFTTRVLLWKTWQSLDRMNLCWEIVTNMSSVPTKLASALITKETVQRISTLITTMMVNEWMYTCGDFILVQVYVDDIIFGSSNPQLCREFKALMHEKFQMSAMDVRSLNTPIDKENPWEKDRTGKDVDLHLHRSMIGSLMYLTTSRPDIMFDVCAYARHQVTPKECHLNAVKRIFRYLKGHPKLGLCYPKESPFDLVAYSDSDYGGATQDCKSTTGGCQFLGRRLISWQCKKQTIVATSTTEA
nr:hypothetical protein [Tanacetum cinerariifolium]